MKKYIVRMVFVLLIIAQIEEVGFAAIMSGEKRSEKIIAARSLLSNQVAVVDVDLLARAPSPFSRNLGNDIEVVEDVARPSLTRDELLLAVSGQIKPTGIFMFGGEYYLIFKEKKFKTGSRMKTTYDNIEYIVEITKITRNAYQVQLGGSKLQLKLK